MLDSSLRLAGFAEVVREKLRLFACDGGHVGQAARDSPVQAPAIRTKNRIVGCIRNQCVLEAVRFAVTTARRTDQIGVNQLLEIVLKCTRVFYPKCSPAARRRIRD